MSKIAYEPEKKLLDDYIAKKEAGKDDLDPIIQQIIAEHFLPQGRFTEANSWLGVVSDFQISTQLKKQIASAEEKASIPNIKRLPKSNSWTKSDIAHNVQDNDDQQYQYDRLVHMLNYRQHRLDDRKDIFECKNEYITWDALWLFFPDDDGAGLNKHNINFETTAMALADYFDYILLPDKFVETELMKSIKESQVPKHATVEAAAKDDPDLLNYIKTHCESLLKEPFITNFWCLTKILGNSENAIVTENYVAFLPGKTKGWSVPDPIIIQRENITEISIGSEFHTEYQGITSKDSAYWTLTFQTNNYQQFTRYMYLGKDENEMNKNRPILGAKLDELGKLFTLTQGDSFTSTGGYQTTFGVGWWMS